MTDIYSDGTYLRHNPGWGAEDAAWKAERVVEFIARNSLKPASVCDVGCGAGEIVVEMSRRMGAGVAFAGFEPSPQAFEICSKKTGGAATFFKGGVEAVEDGRCDVAMALDVIEHIEDYIGFLREFRKKGKHKIFHIPLDLTALSVLRPAAIMETRRVYGHIHYFCKDTALAALDGAGYKIIDWTYTGSGVDFPGASPKAKLLNAARKAAFKANRDLAVRTLGGWSLLALAQ